MDPALIAKLIELALRLSLPTIELLLRKAEGDPDKLLALLDSYRITKSPEDYLRDLGLDPPKS